MLFRLNNIPSARTFGNTTTATAEGGRRRRNEDEGEVGTNNGHHKEECFLMCLNIHLAHRGR